ncbi:MAG TPA: ABC transporter transmembrane domain-containing protein, partial [Gemmatimonadales bacterium]
MKNLRHLLPAMRPYLWTFAGGLALVVVSNFFATRVPQYLQRGIDALEKGGSFALVRHEIALLLAIAAVAGIARFGMRELLNGVSRRVETDLRDRLFQHLQILSASFYDRMPTGDIMARATNDLLAVRMVAGPALMYFVDTIVRTVMVLPYMLLISPRLTGLALLPLIALPVVMVFFGQAIHRRTLAIQAQYSTLTSAAHENISGVRIVRAYQQERAEAVNFRRLNEEYARRNIALARVAGAFHPILALLGGLGGAAVLYIGGSLVVAGTVTVGEFVAFGVYLVTLVWPMIALGWVVNLVQRGEASMGRLLALLQEQPAIVSPAAASHLPAAHGGRTVKYEGVWFRYPNAPERGWVLQDIHFTVEAGRSLAIVGATGSGKSTLVELLPRGYDPDRGRILIDGVDIRALSLADLREAIGFVPQETFLFSETLRNNIL